MAVTSNVFPLRLNGLKEAKCPRLRSIFSTHRCQNTSSGVAQVKSGEERISKLDRGTEQQIRGSWTSSTLHTTRSHSRSQGCTDACQFFRFKAKTSKRCSSPPCGGSSTFALIIQKKIKMQGFLFSLLSQLWWLQENSNLAERYQALKPLYVFCLCVW